MTFVPPAPSMEAFVDLLRRAREAGKITPDKPMTASKICTVLNEKWGWDITDPKVREWCNEARKKRIPIVSSGSGYFYAKDPEDIDIADAHMTSRINSMMEAREGMRAIRQHMINERERFMGGPLMQSLQNEFGPLQEIK